MDLVYFALGCLVIILIVSLRGKPILSPLIITVGKTIVARPPYINPSIRDEPVLIVPVSITNKDVNPIIFEVMMGFKGVSLRYSTIEDSSLSVAKMIVRKKFSAKESNLISSPITLEQEETIKGQLAFFLDRDYFDESVLMFKEGIEECFILFYNLPTKKQISEKIILALD